MIPDGLRSYLDRYPALGLIGNTRLFRVQLREMPQNGSEVFAKAEWTNPGGSLKDRPVLRMLLAALADGELTPERIVLDSSSGNAGIAYAMIGSMLECRVALVVPGNASAERKRRILAHGARLIETDPLEGYDAAVREAHRMAEAQPDRYFLIDQYANDNNWLAHYDGTATEILAQTKGRLTHFVAGVGTGGTLTGMGRRLKEHDSNIEIVQVVPEAFPGIEGLKPMEGPEDIVPRIFDDSIIDRKIHVTADDAHQFCRRLSETGIFVGQSSGAYLKAAMDVARTSPSARIVTLFNDIGERYFSTGLWDA